MHKLRVWAELSDETYHAYQGEAARQGVKVEKLVQQTVNTLLHQLEEEEKEGPERIMPS
ncbi:MAG: hypothetical protein HYW06_00410 [Gemmatimonadetes bacterium]|nr:hypothetical protein [Gemmatimonadota bacterium]MBI2615843.1 hypothetical protein [Gemmatimonadota bacterium]